MFKKYKPIPLICSLIQQIFIEATTRSGAILDAKLFLIFYILSPTVNQSECFLDVQHYSLLTGLQKIRFWEPEWEHEQK